jgi:hypothetical protein
LYSWYSNEANTTWYTEEIPEQVVEIPFTTEAPVIENLPIKRRRKPIK